MFLDLENKEQSSIAAIDDFGVEINYRELIRFSSEFFTYIKKRSLIFILSNNSIGSLAGYVASMNNKVVPLLLNHNLDLELLNHLIDVYNPKYLWVPEEIELGSTYNCVFKKYNYKLLITKCKSFKFYDELALLLSTSGSTGSPKLVRHSYVNINESARSVAKIFELTSADRGIANLPMYYTMGLSVINSHLFAGARLLLSNKSLSDTEFWKFIKDQKATSLTGVPYSYEFLSKIGFFKMDLPDLNIVAQGGGKLRSDLFKNLAEFALKKGKRFFATYGQTEGTARMTYLEPEMAIHKIGSIGKAIPGGYIEIIDKNKKTLTDNNVVGEMVYYGPNVTLGYANKRSDLSIGDENKGVLRTGDIVKRDKDGYYYVIGRMNRFLKIFGLRISLDEMQEMVREKFQIDCICAGEDEKMKVYITKADLKKEVSDFIAKKTRLFHGSYQVEITNEIPRTETGKPIFDSFI